MELQYRIKLATPKELMQFFDRVRGQYSGNAPALLHVESRSWHDAIVAEHDGTIIGAVTLAFHDSDRPEPGTLDTLYVVPEHRGNGVGTRLCELAVRSFVETRAIPAACHATTEAMVRTIERLPSELKKHLHVRRASVDEFFDPDLSDQTPRRPD